MDPTVQVAIVSVFATLITTFGVIVVALINNQKERVRAIKAGVKPTYREEDIDEVLNRLLTLIDENRRKEVTIRKLNNKIREMTDEINEVRAELNSKNQA